MISMMIRAACGADKFVSGHLFNAHSVPSRQNNRSFVLSIILYEPSASVLQQRIDPTTFGPHRDWQSPSSADSWESDSRADIIREALGIDIEALVGLQIEQGPPLRDN